MCVWGLMGYDEITCGRQALTAAATASDCQPNGIPDECDIASHASRDVFPRWPVVGDGIPDECQIDEDLPFASKGRDIR